MIRKDGQNLWVEQPGIRYCFQQNGFLKSASVIGWQGREWNVTPDGDFGKIRICLSDGRELTPVCADEPSVWETERTIVLEYGNIRWQFADGTLCRDFRLSLRYELLSHGRAFVNAFFVAENMHTPDLDQFNLDFHFAAAGMPEVKWAIVPRPKNADASLIQAMRSGRSLLPGDNRRIEKEILPNVTVNLRNEAGETAYFEVFVEGENSISGDNGDNATDLSWTEDGNFCAGFEFIRSKPCKNKLMQLRQWRNQWGWVLKAADTVRQKPPMQMYHYFDNYLRYPTDECLKNLAAAGTDVLILHENWRQDLQNDGTPFDPAELRRVIDTAHRHDIRVALYIRGNEHSAEDGACEWFDRYLKKDYDGLYMDYGGPFHACPAEESYPGGRLPFKNYLLRMESLRDRIGKDGIFYGHTGTSYSAVFYASGMIDGYVSGEGEGGVMVRSRTDHEYYSMAAVSPGTMWTGAFPAYSTAKMRPFLAAAAQYPHSPLGEQFKTSSLAHPREPGLNDTAFKPLWKLWKFFKQERDFTILNDYNSSGVFGEKDPETGHCLMVSQDGKRALLILSNFTEQERNITCKCPEVLCGKTVYRMTPSEKSPGKAKKMSAGDTLTITLGALDAGAFYFDADETLAAEKIHVFETPYPAYSAENRKYLAYLAEQKELRYSPVPAEKILLRLTVPNTNLSYEYSLAYDLYYNAMALVEWTADGTKKRLGWISRKGFTAEEPAAEDYIWPDVVSPAIPLHEILGKGEHFIGIESVHYGMPFYSFLSAELTADGAEPYTLYFLNDLEPDREYLRWKVIVK